MSDPQSRQSNGPEHDPDFIRWRDELRSFEMDGEILYLPTGDIPMTAAEIEDYWRRLREQT
jgi:hypothetical protein